jgi:hypothetical protein
MSTPARTVVFVTGGLQTLYSYMMSVHVYDPT